MLLWKRLVKHIVYPNSQLMHVVVLVQHQHLHYYEYTSWNLGFKFHMLGLAS